MNFHAWHRDFGENKWVLDHAFDLADFGIIKVGSDVTQHQPVAVPYVRNTALWRGNAFRMTATFIYHCVFFSNDIHFSVQAPKLSHKFKKRKT